ncbi:MAG: hypothetical protein R2825_15105 [Saprospiraceae bacterium]
MLTRLDGQHDLVIGEDGGDRETPPDKRFSQNQKYLVLPSGLFSHWPVQVQLPQVASNFPVRAIPVCTSSAMKSAFAALQS